MTSIETASTFGPEVGPQSARRVKPASGGADRLCRLSLRGAGLTGFAVSEIPYGLSDGRVR